MNSTAADRLFAVYEAYSQAYDRRAQDWKEAKTKAQADAIFKDVESLEIAYLKAARQALDANGQAIEDAYQAAKTAQQEVDEAYKAAKGIADKIRLVGNVVGKVGDLIKKASGK